MRRGADKYSLCKVNRQTEIMPLERQDTKSKKRSESPTVNPPGIRVNTRYRNSTKDTSSKKVAYIPSISGTLGDTGVYRHTTEPI